MSKIYDLSSYNFKKGEEILIDTNIWLYLFPAPCNPSHPFAYQYSLGFQNLLKAESKPILDPVVISEYINSYCRIEWKAFNEKNFTDKKFKEFRDSTDFNFIISAVDNFVEKILNFCFVNSIPIDKSTLRTSLTCFSCEKIDFNDSLIIETCKRKNFKLMTNDHDFQCANIDILTTNPKLLNR